MKEKELTPDHNFSLTIPIKIAYPVIEAQLRKKFIGEILSKESTSGKLSTYAEILDISLLRSEIEEFDLAITLRLKTLTFLYRNRELDITVYVGLDFDSETQKISIKNYEIDSRGKSWMADKLLESVLNKFMYQKVRTKLNFDLMPMIQEQLNLLNDKLASRLEAVSGIYIMGAMERLQISELEARENELWIFMTLEGWGVVEIEDLEF